MTPEVILSGVSVVVACVALVVSTLRHRAGAGVAKRQALLELGQAQARIAVAYARAQPGDSAQVRTHAIDAFRMADTAADGRRDFSDRDAARYVDAELNKESTK